jgi:hypothetical protein
MNRETYNNKKPTVIVIVATISVLFVAPSALSIPVYALGHWYEGDVESSGEENTVISTEDRKKLVSCLNDTREGSISTQDEIKDCLNTVRGDEENTEDNASINRGDEENTEDNVSISDDDGIAIIDDDPENSDTINSNEDND